MGRPLGLDASAARKQRLARGRAEARERREREVAERAELKRLRAMERKRARRAEARQERESALSDARRREGARDRSRERRARERARREAEAGRRIDYRTDTDAKYEDMSIPELLAERRRVVARLKPFVKDATAKVAD